MSHFNPKESLLVFTLKAPVVIVPILAANVALTNFAYVNDPLVVVRNTTAKYYYKSSITDAPRAYSIKLIMAIIHSVS